MFSYSNYINISKDFCNLGLKSLLILEDSLSIVFYYSGNYSSTCPVF